MPVSHRRWTAEELALIAQSPSLAEAQKSLPDRTAQAVESCWRNHHVQDIQATSRPPQTADEYQVAHLLAYIRRVCWEAQVRPDVTALLSTLRGRWREYLEGDSLPTGLVTGQVVAWRRAPH